MNYKKFDNKSAARLGNFKDNSAFGGSVVKVGNRKIHIQGGVEKSIWDAYKKDPKRAESILAARIGVAPETASINENTGYREYNDNDGWWGGFKKAVSSPFTAGKDLLGEAGALWDQYVSEPFQQKFEIGEYDPENIMKDQLSDMLEPSIANVIKGTKQMGGFLEEQYESRMGTMDLRKEDLWSGLGNAQQQTAIDYQNMPNVARTGLVTSGSNEANIKAIEKAGEQTISGIGTRQKLIDFEKGQLGTQLDIDKLQADIRAQETISSILGDYMAATGEPIGDEFMDLLENINESGVSGVDYG